MITNKFRIIAGLFMFTVIILSCSKARLENEITLEEILSVGGGSGDPNDSVKSFIVVRMNRTINAYDSTNAFDITAFGEFRDANGNRVSAGNITVNGRSVPTDPNNFYKLPYSGSLLNEGKSFYGSDIEVSISGAGDIAPLSKTLYVPKEFVITWLSYPYDRISRTQNTTLNWVPDTRNIFRKAMIQVHYYSALSRIDLPNAPVAITGLKYLVNDNGQFTIPASDMNRFPAGTYVQVSIGRAVEYEANYSGLISGLPKRVHFFTVTDSQTIPLRVY